MTSIDHPASGLEVTMHLPGEPSVEENDAAPAPDHVRRPKPAETAPDNAEADPVIDHAVLDGLAEMIGREMMPELFNRIDSDLTAARDALEAAIDPLDPDVIRAKSHILISVAGAFGAARLQRCATALNRAAHAPDDPTLPTQVRACLAEVGAVMGFVTTQRMAC